MEDFTLYPEDKDSKHVSNMVIFCFRKNDFGSSVEVGLELDRMKAKSHLESFCFREVMVNVWAETGATKIEWNEF